MTPPVDEHDCAWKQEVERLRLRVEELGAKLEQAQEELGSLKRRLYGKKSERLPPISEELRRTGTRPDPAAAQRKRQERAAARAKLPERVIYHPVPQEQRRCPACSSREELKPLGAGRTSAVYEYVPPRFEKQVHVQEVLACTCGKGIITAEVPPKVVEKGDYGPALVAHLVTAKCADSMPLYRLEKAFARQGLLLSRSTMVDLFHRAAEAVAPLAARLVSKVAEADVVFADETPQRVQAEKQTRTAYLWTFLTDGPEPLIAYRFSPTRSGQTPIEVLGGTRGALVVDGYTGYNQVTTPKGRVRIGCWGHARRKFHDALPYAPDAQQALSFICELYRVEEVAKESGIHGKPPHRTLREQRSLPILYALHAWLEERKGVHLPQSKMGKAIRYALNQWTALTRFVTDERLPLDNNRSERALRVAALGRKNFLFVGHDDAGRNLAGLYSLVATCEANGINPERYLADVLIRVQTHVNSNIDELLPVAWAKKFAADSS